jgi:hypothetical protein
MATRVANLAPTNVSDASFRLWINEIHNSLIAFGWLQTSDTGQINFSTVTRPTNINLYQGYAIYKMNDSLQSSCAVFMRLDFGTGGGGDSPSLKIKIGIGSTDGAGTLTGNLATQVVMGTLTGANTTGLNVYTAGDAGSFRMAWWLSEISGLGWVVAIERDQDSSGADTSVGVTLCTYFATTGNGSSTTNQFLEQAGGTGAQFAAWYTWVSTQTSNSGYSGASVAPVHPVLGYLRNPMKTLLLGAVNDWVTNTTVSVTVYGTARTYMVKGGNGGGGTSQNIWATHPAKMFILWQ